MQAIEFTAKVKDGIIEIPKEHLQEIKGFQNNLRIIILGESQQEKSPQKKKITSLNIDTQGLHFDRDEANER